MAWQVPVEKRTKDDSPKWPGSDLFRHDERLAVSAAQELVRLQVVPDRLGLGVEVQHPADAQGDVAEVAQPRALVPLLDVGVGALAALDAVEEVAEVRP